MSKHTCRNCGSNDMMLAPFATDGKRVMGPHIRCYRCGQHVAPEPTTTHSEEGEKGE